jgi:hypothetical protein|nr:MAG TPA: hypothetical protein [Caudoviricetes sp.]
MITNKNKAAIKTMIYPTIEKNMQKNYNQYRQCVAEFVTDRNKSLFNTMPLDRIYYGTDDIDKMFKAVDISISAVKTAILNTYYGNKANFNPRAAKDELTILVLCICRYFFMKKDTKNLELAMAYLSFSGKFYPSIHYMAFPKLLPQEFVMQYVINNSLNNKFVLKSTGNIFNSIVYLCKTMISTYAIRFKEFEDDDVVYLIGQLHGRIRSFMINIARAYYKAYENKDYITFNSDNENPQELGGTYHLADSDSFKAEKCIQKSMQYIVASGADYKICKMCSNKTVKTEELKSIIETILNDKQNLVQVRRVISILVYTYYGQATDKNVVSMNFITFSITPKPNSKDHNIIEMRNYVEKWLMTSALYRKKKTRLASKNDYNRALLMYFAMLIYAANK